MRFAASLAAALALAGCSSQGEANLQDEDLKAYVVEAAVVACSEQAEQQAQSPQLDVDFTSACECGVSKVIKDLPVGEFAAITSDDDVTALVARLGAPAEEAAKECAAKRRLAKA
ncbi:MAG: hypothetical protein J7493_14255 [Porphyrobacter sp.]|nr:hypothetical protein [Porphyrobacter sp.]